MLSHNEKGHAFILTLIILCVGSMIVPPLLSIAQSGLTIVQTYEENMHELYAAEAGVEDTMYRIINDDPAFTALDIDETYDYTLSEQVGDLDVGVSATSLSLMTGILGENKHRHATPHSDFVVLASPLAVDEIGEDYIVYSGTATVTYDDDGPGHRNIEMLGFFIYPPPDGGDDAISDPYDIVDTGALDDYCDNWLLLRTWPVEPRMITGAFMFLWEWRSHPACKPQFPDHPVHGDNTGTLSFKFKVDDPTWAPSTFFVFTTWQSGDIDFATNGNFEKWIIESTAGSTSVYSVMLNESGTPHVLTWEINREE